MAANLESILLAGVPESGIPGHTGKTSGSAGSNGEFKSMFSSFLQERRDSLKETLEELEEKRQEAKELEDARHAMEIEVIRRIMPDGSILVTEYHDGKVASRFRKRPYMVEVPDPNAAIPRNSDGNIITGQQEMKLKPKFSAFEDLV